MDSYTLKLNHLFVVTSYIDAEITTNMNGTWSQTLRSSSVEGRSHIRCALLRCAGKTLLVFFKSAAQQRAACV